VQVSVLLDGEVVDRFDVAPGGEFVSFPSIDASTNARVISLQAAFEGQTVDSEVSFVLTPTAVTQVEDVAEAAATEVQAVATGTAENVAVQVEPTEEEVAPDTVENAGEEQTSASVSEEDPEQPAEVGVAVLRADAEGVKLVQPATQVASALIDKLALDTISYSDLGDVLLAGRAKPDVLVRVYLDNTLVADLRSAGSGHWQGSLTGIVPGIYTLRLDETNVQGIVLSRLETPFKRETPEALQPAPSTESEPIKEPPLVRAITVQKGDTLWAISREKFGDGLLYVRLFQANKDAIRDPDLIYPGQVFTIPD